MTQDELCDGLVGGLIEDANLLHRSKVNMSTEAFIIEHQCFAIIDRLPFAESGQKKMKRRVVRQIIVTLGVY